MLKPDGSETVNVGTQLNANLDKIDLNMNFRVCTSTTRPSVVYAGMSIYETNTGNCYVSNGSSPASASWTSQLLTTSGPVSVTGTNLLNLSGSATGTDKMAVLVAGDTFDRMRMRADGYIEWGSGSAARDTNLYRSGVNTLKTDDVFSALTETTTSGLVAATNFTTSSFSARKTCGVCTVVVVMTRSGTTVTADSAGNITDTLAATLPSGWRPSQTVLGLIDKGGAADGSATILNDGTITLKTLSPTATIASGANVTVTATYVL
ncbi:MULTISPECIES: hypothetical protein [unclassified Streptomyces]|uniref:hypothetical protein n=1 Tax=unclassified Streptomyces TaxID=2593676 RepID=UPI002E281D8F|nr:hypothetical protein [Streptomyces sp. NBC_00228]